MTTKIRISDIFETPDAESGDLAEAAETAIESDTRAPTRSRRDTGKPRTRSMSATKKASYESNVEVQRWLKQQAVEESGLKPPFDPAFLAESRDRPWLLSSLTAFYDDGLITDVLHEVKSGKEASVYCCAAHPATGLARVAAKVYRPRMFRSLKHDAVYRRGRAQHDEEGNTLGGRRARLHADRKTVKGRAFQVAQWIGYEYETQRLLYDAGADVPKPLAQTGNAVLMDYIGTEEGAAPLLQDVRLDPGETGTLFERVLHNIELWLAHERIHGDLSAYNMLYLDGAITVIDFAQAIDPRYSSDAFSLLARDIERVCAYFARYGVTAHPATIATDLWTRYLRAELE